MARRVRLTERAQSDLDSIVFWLRQPGAGPAAAFRLTSIRAAIRTLAQAPCAFPVRIGRDTRVAIRERHRIVFIVTPDTGDNATAGDVDVLRILGPGQNDD